MSILRRMVSTGLLAATATTVGCTFGQPETAPVPQTALDSARAAVADTIRDRESGSAGYVIPPRLDPRKHGPRRFYTGKQYGSEQEFSPVTELLNEGYDILSTDHANHHIWTWSYGTDANYVINSVLHPIKSFQIYGWNNLVKAELLPLTYKRTATSGKWISNYELHMFGTGMVALRMTDWYELHGYDHAALLGQASTWVAQYLNEISDNYKVNYNEDPVVDLAIFDVAGFILWHQHWMQRDFTGKFQLTNWPLQPSYDPVNRTLENAGQFFMLRGPLPFVKTWDFFTIMGESGSLGLSKTIGGGRALSVGLGFDGVSDQPATATTTAVKGGLLPKATIYFDRNSSLLWSVTLGNRTDATRTRVNIYPGVLRIHGFTTGLWSETPKGGGFKGGIISVWGFGVGGSSRKE